jgi:hypothetical protein
MSSTSFHLNTGNQVHSRPERVALWIGWKPAGRPGVQVHPTRVITSDGLSQAVTGDREAWSIKVSSWSAGSVTSCLRNRNPISPEVCRCMPSDIGEGVICAFSGVAGPFLAG